MNERIKELMTQSGMISESSIPGMVVTTNMSLKTAEKFAELIVAECIDVFSKDLPEDSSKMLEVVNRVCNVADHFGFKK